MDKKTSGERTWKKRASAQVWRFQRAMRPALLMGQGEITVNDRTSDTSAPYHTFFSMKQIFADHVYLSKNTEEG